MRSDPRQQADAGSQALALGATLSAVARTCLPVGIIALLLNRADYAGIFCATLFLMWASSEWFGAQVRMDRRLFKRVAHATFQMESMDDILGRPSRSVSARIQGALKVLRCQALCTAACVILTVLLLGHVALG